MQLPWKSETARRADAARKARKRRRGVVAGGLLVSLWFLAMWGNARDAGPAARLIVRVLSPLLRVERATAQLLTAGSGRFSDLWRASGDLARLRERNQALEANRLEENLLIEENRFLRRSLGLLAAFETRALPARVIGGNELGSQSLVVDLGTEDGVRPYDPVFRPEGAVGYIGRVLEHTSLVLLLTDRNVRLGVSVITDASAAPVEGRIRGLPDGTHLLLQTKTAEPIPPGSQVVTSSLSTIFLPGVAVGRVEASMSPSGGLFDEYVVVPAAELERPEWVLVLTGTHREEAARLVEGRPEREGAVAR